MESANRLSLAEEIGLLLDLSAAIDEEDFIQNFMFLIREESTDEVIEIADWEITSSSVASSEISTLIDYLLDLKLIEYSSNPGYRLTEKGKQILLSDIPDDVKGAYIENYHKVRTIGTKKDMAKTAKKRYFKSI
jgi:predicted transcriptional regulator